MHGLVAKTTNEEILNLSPVNISEKKGKYLYKILLDYLLEVKL